MLKLLLLLSLVLTGITGHAVKKTQSENLAFESIEDVGRQLAEEEEGLLKVRIVREAVASQSSKKKATNKRRKTEKKTLRQKDRKEVKKKKGKIGSFSRKKPVKGGKNKNRKQKSKARKNKNGKGVKKNKERKSDKRKSKIKSKLQRHKQKKLNKKSKKERKEKDKKDENGSCLSTDCIDLAVSINELMRFKVFNFKKQVKRILSKRNIGSKKSSKGNVFKSALSRLVVAGGNVSDPVCAGSTNNTGARQLTNLSETLTKCEANITALCDPSNLPELNLTFIGSCEVSISAFEAFIARCSALSGAAACSCWSGDSNSTAVIAAVKQCDLGDLPKKTRFAIDDCMSAFGTCRKYEDDVAAALYACDQNPNILKKKLKNLSENKAAVTQVQTKISSLMNSRREREKRQAETTTTGITGTTTTGEDDASTSAGFISLCLKVTTLIAQEPSSYLILIYSTSILASTVTSFSATDLSSLSTISTQMAVAVTVLDAEISTATTTIEGIIIICKNTI